MESPAAARLSAVGAHLASAAAEPAPPEPSDGALSGDEIAAFVARGFHVVDTRGDISAEFHAAFAARSREINDRPREVPLQDVGFLELEEEMAVVLRCPSVRGALSSLLGSDFATASEESEEPRNLLRNSFGTAVLQLRRNFATVLQHQPMLYTKKLQFRQTY